MTKRISWKKGMRLTDELLRHSDEYTSELIDRSVLLASAGRFGLLPFCGFDLSVNISKGFVDIESLNCTAVTKSGHIVDAHYDTKYTNTFDTRVQIPTDNGEKEYILTINYTGQWKDAADDSQQPVYSFSLVARNSVVPPNSLPIARIANQFDWHLDDADFVPPCLFVSSHDKYIELMGKYRQLLSEINSKLARHLNSDYKPVVAIFWPTVQQLMIEADKEQDVMTPMGLLSSIQKCVSAFTCACEIADGVALADAEQFKSYIHAPYNYKDCYLRIKEGLELCFSISEKVNRFQGSAQPVQAPAVASAPKLADSMLNLDCGSPKSTITLTYHDARADIYFTTDGQNPSPECRKAMRTGSGYAIEFDNGFSGNGKEADHTLTLKLLAVVAGAKSEISSYSIKLMKSLRFRDNRRI